MLTEQQAYEALLRLPEHEVRALLRAGLRALWRADNHAARFAFADAYATRSDGREWDYAAAMCISDAGLVRRVPAWLLVDAAMDMRAALTEMRVLTEMRDAYTATADARAEDEAVDRAHEEDMRYGWNGKEG